MKAFSPKAILGEKSGQAPISQFSLDQVRQQVEELVIGNTCYLKIVFAGSRKSMYLRLIFFIYLDGPPHF